MKVTFSYAGKIGGLGQGYITGNTVMAAIRNKCLYQLFARDFDEDIGEKAQEALRIKALDEFSVAHGLLARLLARIGMTYFVSNVDFDNKVARKLKRCDIFHAFAAQSLKSILRAKELGAKVVADNPTAHPMFLKKILAEEYKRWKVPFIAYNQIALNRRIRALDQADRIVVLSNFSYKTFLNEGVSPEKLRILPYGVDIEFFKPRPKPDNVFRALCIGQLSLRKGIQYLLEAWKLLGLKDAELVLVGGCKPDALYALKKYEGVVNFKMRGPLTDITSVAREYNEASVAVFPSIEDGFGMVVTEAMASGLPVIVSENVGAKDLINHGEEGFVVPIRDPGALKDAILCLYEDKNKREQMGRKARLMVQNETWQKYQDKLVDVYREFAR